MQSVAQRCNYHSVEDLIAGLGYGEVTLNLVVNRLRDLVKVQQKIEAAPAGGQELPQLIPASTTPKPVPSSSPSKSPIAGVEGLLYYLASCCCPIPGEAIIGVVTRSRGISIHRQGCSNVESVPGDRLVPVSWNSSDRNASRPNTYAVNIQIEALDRVGVLNDVLSHLKDNKVNVRSAQVKTYPGLPALIDLCMDIEDKEQFERTCMQIKKMSDILNLRRVSQVN
jgi:GTP pyrophosphokinase